MFAVAVVSVDQCQQVGGGQGEFRAFMVARGGADSALVVAVNRQSGDVQRASPDAFVSFPFAPDAQNKRVADYFPGIESAE